MVAWRVYFITIGDILTVEDERKAKKVYAKRLVSFEEIRPTGVYVRISTAKSKQSGSLNSQIDRLVEYVEKDFFRKLGGIYLDVGSGRSADSRKDLKRLIADCRSGEIRAIVTKSVSRFGRNTAETLKLCRELKDIGVDVYFHQENIHSMDPHGELNLTLVSAIAEGESYNKSESIKWGIEKRAQDPEAGIYSRPCYGYTKDDQGHLAIVGPEAEVVRDIFKMYIDGASIVSIQKYLSENGVPSPTGKETWPKRTLEKMLQNEKYHGDVILYKTYTDEFPSTKRIENKDQKEKFLVEEHHQGIISKELFEQAQECMRSRKRTKNDVE